MPNTKAFLNTQICLKSKVYTMKPSILLLFQFGFQFQMFQFVSVVISSTNHTLQLYSFCCVIWSSVLVFTSSFHFCPARLDGYKWRATPIDSAFSPSDADGAIWAWARSGGPKNKNLSNRALTPTCFQNPSHNAFSLKAQLRWCKAPGCETYSYLRKKTCVNPSCACASTFGG